MRKLKFVQQDPNVPSYKARISAEEWVLYENVIRDWHHMGKTREETLSVLEKHFSFVPSLAQLNAQMRVWGLKTYKKNNNGSQYEDQLKNRKYNSKNGSPLIQAAINSNEKLLAIMKDYEIHLQSDTAPFIHSLWNFIFGEESIEAFLENLHGFATSLLYSDTLEHIGDLFFGGGALDDAFDMYSRSIYIKVRLRDIDQKVFVSYENLVGHVIKCAQSAVSVEQKKVAFALLEHYLLYQSLTGRLASTVSQVLRSYYTSQDPIQESNLEPCIGPPSEFEMDEFLESITSILNATDVTIEYMQTTAKQPGELCLPFQYAIYSHLWQELINPRYLPGDTGVVRTTTRCRILAKFSRILAQKLVDKYSEALLSMAGVQPWFTIKGYLISMINDEAYTVEKLRCDLMRADESSPTLDDLRETLQCDRSIQTQCIEWLKIQTLEFVGAHQRPSSWVYSPRREREKETTGQTASQSHDAEAMDVDMTQSSHHDAPYSSTILTRPPAIPQSLYLCSSSIRSSMFSMLSMASRIKRNARDSTFSILSKMSSNSKAMGMSGNFDFGQITGMGSDPVRPPSMDVVMVEEEASPEKNPRSRA